MQINNKKNSNHPDAVDFYQHFINILRANQAELRFKREITTTLIKQNNKWKISGTQF